MISLGTFHSLLKSGVTIWHFFLVVNFYKLVWKERSQETQRRYNVAATLRRSSDVVTTLLLRCVFAGVRQGPACAQEVLFFSL